MRPKMQRVNVEGTHAVLEVAQKSGVSKVVYCSTLAYMVILAAL